MGFEAELKENLTLRDLEEFTADGKPVIVVGQFWRSASGPAKSVAEDWSSGHYVVVLGVDKDYVYIQDPYMRMSKAFVPRKAFEDHWHQVMGGDLENKPKLIHLGIFVRGDKPAETAAVEEADIASLKLAEMGSFNLMVTEFKGFLLPFDFLDELRDVWKQQGVRPSAFIFLRKDKDGNVMGIQGSGIEDDEEAVVAMNAVLAALASQSMGRPEARKSKVESAMKAAAAGDFGLSADDFREIAHKLPPDHSAIIGLFENVWEKRFKQAAKKHGGDGDQPAAHLAGGGRKGGERDCRHGPAGGRLRRRRGGAECAIMIIKKTRKSPTSSGCAPTPPAPASSSSPACMVTRSAGCMPSKSSSSTFSWAGDPAGSLTLARGNQQALRRSGDNQAQPKPDVSGGLWARDRQDLIRIQARAGAEEHPSRLRLLLRFAFGADRASAVHRG